MKISFKFLLTTILITMTLALTSCNTAAGFGRDLQKGGQKIQEAAGTDMAGK